MLRWRSGGQLQLLEPAVVPARVPVESRVPMALSHCARPAQRLVVCRVAGCMIGYVPAGALLHYHTPHPAIPEVVDIAVIASWLLQLSMGSAT